MGSLLVVIAVAAAVIIWVRGARASRARWLARLSLPGVWEREGDSGRLELTGHLDGGEYRLKDGHLDESGTWHLEGHTLHLDPGNGRHRQMDLRLFEEGRIGLDGPDLPRRVYRKVPSNVVPLRGRSGR